MSGEHVLPEAAAFPVRRPGVFARTGAAIARFISQKMAPKPAAGVGLFLNPEKLARHFNAEKAGRDDGLKNWPEVEAETLTDFEARVRGRTNDALARLKRQTISILTGYKTELDEIDIGPVGSVISRVENAVAQNFMVLRNEHYDPLVELRRHQLSREREYQHFRLENSRRRMARPESPLGFTIGILIILVLLEGAMNAFFFQEMSDFGLLGGFALAGIISGINIVVCFFLIGRLVFRNLLHVRRARRVAAWLGVIISILALASFHYTIGRARAIFEFENTDTGTQTHLPSLSELYTHPVDWTIMSGLLVILGVFFAAIAIADGFYISGDPYPGYGAVSQARNNAGRAYAAGVKKLTDDTKALINKAKAEIDTVVNVAESKLLRFSAILHQFSAVVNLFEQNATQMETACDRVLQAYRESNRQVRTQTAPLYFDTVTTLDRNIGTEIGDALDPLKGMNETVESLKVQAEAAKDRLHKVYDNQIQNIAEDLRKIDATAVKQADDDSAALRQAAGLKI